MFKRIWGWLATLLLVGLMVAPGASADPYTDGLVKKFNQTTHVVTDPAAKPPLTNGPALNDQIVQGRRPIYVAVVAPPQSGVTTPDSLYLAWTRVRGRFEGVLLVMDAKGYHVRGFNVPQQVANSINPLIAQSIAEHRNDPAGTLSAFVSKLSQVKPAPLSAPAAQTHEPRSWTWLWVTLSIIGGVIVLALLIWGVSAYARRRSAKREELENLQDSIIGVEAGADDLASAVLKSMVDVSSEQSKVSLALADAKKAFKDKDYATARSHLAVANKYIAAANAKLKPPVPAGETFTTVNEKRAAARVESEPTERRQGSVRATNPDTGRKVTIKNYNYRTNETAQYPHYYGGGYLNGLYFHPGYYPYPFWGAGWAWSPVDVLLTHELLADHWEGAASTPTYDAGYDTQASTEAAGWNEDTNFAGTTTDAGFDGSDVSTTDSSSSDFSYAGSDDTPSYSSNSDSDYSGSSSSSSDSYSSSYDSGSSGYSSSYDSSSYDSGSSTSSWDSGGSSYDSGSSSSGFDSGGW
ncbi:putative membrane protein YgcG [Mycolicibacterium sp. BK634]|uniref:hypothetical protein n=1 Tax=Mycolicibacterium sp. BK634 TaxID=2587099 RepID=UPI00160E5283|nr:hypothetical protein [Mycolicibacterium sp. BK634]MBB3752405.1 putative membrane protein YgcG [Mycolicibacterium sp. BK634]